MAKPAKPERDARVRWENTGDFGDAVARVPGAQIHVLRLLETRWLAVVVARGWDSEKEYATKRGAQAGGLHMARRLARG